MTTKTFQGEQILYQEWFGSGNSQANSFLKIVGANNCLLLVVTVQAFWVVGWPIFRPITQLLDLNHRIPLDRIQSIQHLKSRILKGQFQIDFLDEFSQTHSLRLHSWSPQKLGAALRDANVPVDAEFGIH